MLWAKKAVTIFLSPIFLAPSTLVLGQGIGGNFSNLLEIIHWRRNPEPIEAYHEITVSLNPASACVLGDSVRHCETMTFPLTSITKPTVKVMPTSGYRFSHWADGADYILGWNTNKTVTLSASELPVASLNGTGEMIINVFYGREKKPRHAIPAAYAGAESLGNTSQDS